MKIEYLLDGSADCPLVRIFDFEPSEIDDLRSVCRALQDGSIDHFRLDLMPSLEPIGGCQLTLCAEDRDRGLTLISPPASFQWILSRGAWNNVEGLLEPFRRSGARAHQWLNSLGEASVLISSDGSW